MPSPSLLKILSIFVKLAYDVLKVGTVGKIEDEDNHKKYVSSKRQGKILRKIIKDIVKDNIFKYKPIGAMTEYHQYAKEKGKATVHGIICAITIT